MMRIQHGFTLFESLVAMTLMALLLGALLPVFQGGLATLRFGAEQTRAALLAQALLNRALVEQTGTELLPPLSGETDGLRWQIQRRPYLEAELSIADEYLHNGPLLWDISSRVEWGNKSFVVLRGLAPVVSRTTLAGQAGAS